MARFTNKQSGSVVNVSEAEAKHLGPEYVPFEVKAESAAPEQDPTAPEPEPEPAADPEPEPAADPEPEPEVKATRRSTRN